MEQEGARTPPPAPGENRRRSVRIAYLLPNLESGGTERHLLTLVRRLDPARYRLSLLTTAGGGRLWRAFRDLIPVHVYGDPHKGRSFRSSPVRHLRTVLFLAGVLRRERPDILHAYLPAANLLGPLAARLAGVPRIVISKRALANYKDLYPRLRRLEPLGNRLADAILVNSDAVRRDVERTERFWEGKFQKVYNGVAPIPPWSEEQRESFRRREGIPPGAPAVLAVSNFYPYKGHGDLVSAFAIVAGKVPEALLLLVGRDAGTMEAVRAQAAAAGLEDSVRFLGDRSDVPDLLRAADLFVHPSHEEGFSNALLEAMSAGRAAVACEVGGNVEAVVPGVTGLLVPVRRPDLFAEAMAALLANPGRRVEMEEAARRRAGENFSLEAMADGIGGLYDLLMRGRT